MLRSKFPVSTLVAGIVNFQKEIRLTIRRWMLRGLGLVLAPPTCCLCGEPGFLLQGAEPGLIGQLHRVPLDLCTHCAAVLPRPAEHWTQVWMQGGTYWQFAAFQYGYPVDRLVREFKFRGDRVYGRVLATLLAISRAGTRSRPLPDAIVPVPLHSARFRERGFDQTKLLADWVGEVCNLPVLHQCLARIRATVPQSGLAGAARRQNVQGAFAVRTSQRPGVASMPQHVALLDDVLTTGSTLAAASAALRAVGVTTIEHWVLARTALAENILQRDADEHHQSGVPVFKEGLETSVAVAIADQPLLAHKTQAERQKSELIPKT